METVQYDYKQILQRIVAEIKSSRIQVARKITSATMELYWNIGKELSAQHLSKGYGAQVVEMLASDLQKEFPGTTGFSSRNLWEMKRFYERYYGESQKLQQSVAVLPWGHNLLLMSKCKNPEEIYFYATRSTELGWTRDVLLNYIKADAFSTREEQPKLHNFKETLPECLQEQAEEMLKSRYNLEFLGITKPILELELERRLVDKIKTFLLEMGKGFSFIGNQYRLVLEDKEYFVDMLFFNRCTRSLIALELKIGSFQPEYVGKMNFYLNLLDRQVKMPDENPSIGIILCADRNNVEVEVALQGSTAPIGVSEYSYLIPQKQIKELINNELSGNKE